MSESPDRPMLGGCCICLDERGWAENPLVYCDGQGCSVAVHQACYGIVSVPSGPWYCRRCEVHGSTVQLSCVLCPYRGGAMKKTDKSEEWAHAICALYIPEVEFGNVSSMEPIVLEKIPEERYKKECCVCEKEGRSEKQHGACMNCAKSGCKLSFHVICALLSSLLCEEAGASNKTKYCGYCPHHFSKIKKGSSFKNLACAKVYKLPQEALNKEKIEISADSLSIPIVKCEIPDSKDTESQSESEVDSHPKQENSADAVLPAESVDEKLSVPVPTTTQSPAVVEMKEDATNTDNIVTPKKSSTVSVLHCDKPEIKKKVKRKSTKGSERDGNPSKKVNRPKKPKTATSSSLEKHQKIRPTIPVSLIENADYAVAPKHSVISLSEFGDTSLEPSHPSDIGKTKPSPSTCNNNMDGLAAIEHMIEQQESDLMGFFQEFGAPSHVAQFLQTLKNLQDENSQVENAIQKMTHRRDQLVAIKARLSVPLQSAPFPRACSNTTDSIDSKQFSVPHDQQTANPVYPYFVNKN